MTAVVEREQRPTSTLPVLHLERSVPQRKAWDLTVEGLVASPCSFSLDALRALPQEERTWDMHCVWGWSKPACRWRGVGVATLLARAQPLPEGRYGVALSADDGYASCLSIDELRASLIAFELDGKTLDPKHGAPMRLIPPPSKWAYKGVKWITRIAVVARFTPGPWETLVGKPHGDVPAEMLDLGSHDA